jgi:hypothetical protein
MLLDPFPAGRGGFRIVIQLEAGANPDIGIRRAQLFDFIKIDPGVITIVIGESDVVQPDAASIIDPGLEERGGIRLHTVTLRMRMIIGD